MLFKTIWTVLFRRGAKFAAAVGKHMGSGVFAKPMIVCRSACECRPFLAWVPIIAQKMHLFERPRVQALEMWLVGSGDFRISVQAGKDVPERPQHDPETRIAGQGLI